MKTHKEPHWKKQLDKLFLMDCLPTKAAPGVIHRVLLYGAPGTGKSGAAWHASDGQAERITLDMDMDKDTLIGMLYPSKDGTLAWGDGCALRAMRGGKMLIFDEIDACSPECREVLHGLLDDLRMARIQISGKDVHEAVEPAQGFMVVATTNANPGDLPPAILDRFDVILHADTPSAGVLQGMPQEYAELAINTVRSGDTACEDFSPAPTPRRIRAWLALESCLGRIEAAKMVFGRNADDVLMATARKNTDDSAGSKKKTRKKTTSKGGE